MGAGKWCDDLSVYFMDRNVVILLDNDDAGRKHAQQVATALHGIAATVRVVELPGLPQKGDVSGWLDAGGRLRDLRALGEASPQWEPDRDAEPAAPNGPALVITSLSNVQSRDIDWFRRKWLARGKVHIIGGHAGDGKRTLTAWLASTFARWHAAGRRTLPGRACPVPAC